MKKIFLNSRRCCSSIINKYRIQNHRENILSRPDSYIGSTKFLRNDKLLLYNEKLNQMVKSDVNYVPGFLKIYDEILVNAADNKQRDPKMTKIEIVVDKESSLIKIRNNGKSIPVEIHPSMNLFIPTLVMGHLLTSSNYDDYERRIVGGRNGYGAKLCNIYSKKFTVVAMDCNVGKKFTQTWYDNMSRCDEPIIEDIKCYDGLEDYTEVSFIPDLEKFKIEHFDDDVINILKKRAYDMAGTCDDVQVFFNNEMLNVSNFEEYVKIHLTENKEMLKKFKCDRWEIFVTESSHGFHQVSYVNNIATLNGGTHVDYVTDQIISIIKKLIKKKLEISHQQSLITKLKNFHIKNNLIVFIKCSIENPSFSSQTKEQLISKSSEFGSTCNISESFVSEFLESSNIYENVLMSLKNAPIKKDGIKKNISFHPKLEDAVYAGTSSSKECSLFLTEGDSAKALAVAGLSVIGREYNGVFPLKGKIINVRDLTFEEAMKNIEFQNIVKIINLKKNFNYSLPSNMDTLRYGKVILFADQDLDGIHIKGLVINLFHKFWPQLIEMGFVKGFRTPLIKAKRGSEVINFYNKFEFDEWVKEVDNLSKYKIKYYKGLGTSTTVEAKEYFENINSNLIAYTCNDEIDHLSIESSFKRSLTMDRKIMIKNHIAKNTSTNLENSLTDFVNNDLADFFKHDLKRSIPNVVDGLKISQRKILYTMFKKFENEEIKVNQLAGATAHHSLYHHGEKFLTDAIVKMAQNFVGCGNINLLKPIGQFGTRTTGGDDAASGRYIYTSLESITRILFPKEDDDLLEYLNDESQIIEPSFYVPIIPMVLVNGSKGIGSGWKTSIYSYNPKDIVSNILRMIDNKDPLEMIPFYRNFKGSIEKTSRDGVYKIMGISKLINRIDNNITRIEITELPIGMWTDKFKEKYLQPLYDKKILLSYRELHKNGNVHFILDLKKSKTPIKTFDLTSTINTNNMMLFNDKDDLTHYKTTNEIFYDFFEVRKKLYQRRREKELGNLEKYLIYFKSQKNFIETVLNDRMLLSNKSKEDIIRYLQVKGFPSNPLKKDNNYDYITNIPFYQFTSVEIEKLNKKIVDREEKINLLKSLSWKDLWRLDLEKFQLTYK
uniref:DNA topoisomerase 2 n=1 Tax=Parastrongyloides trichosuri TaxID=131310 RepID=A0A0N4ZF54_PARTI